MRIAVKSVTDDQVSTLEVEMSVKKSTEQTIYDVKRLGKNVNSDDSTTYYEEVDNESSSFYKSNSSNTVDPYHNGQDSGLVLNPSEIMADEPSGQISKLITSQIGGEDSSQDKNEDKYDLSTAEGWKNVGVSALRQLDPGIEAAVNSFKEVFGNEEPVVSGLNKEMLALQNWKNKNYKKIHLSDWRDSEKLNNVTNAANSAMSDLRGELGKTTGGLGGLASTNTNGNVWATAGGQLADQLIGGAGTWNTVSNILGDFGVGGSNFSDAAWNTEVDELAVLNTVTKDTMYTSKPGVRFKAKPEVIENITGNTESAKIFGSKRYNKEGEVYKTFYGTAIEKLRSQQVEASKLSKIRTLVLNGKVEFSKKKLEYSIVKSREAGDLISVTNDESNLTWNFSDEVLSNLSDEEAKMIAALKQRNTFNKSLGCIYIRPFYQTDVKDYASDNFGNLQIPFEFNPNISETPMQANYQTETLLGRLGQYHIFTGTNLSQLSIELQYQSLAPDTLDDYDMKNIGRQYSTDAWQYYWTNSRIEAIELKLRSLVLGSYTTDGFLVKPPLVEIHLENNSAGAGNKESITDVGDLYKYPAASNGSKDVGSEYLSYTKSLGREDSLGNRFKKYVVTSVQIDKLTETDILYPTLYGRVYDSNYRNSLNPMNHLTTGNDGSTDGVVAFQSSARRKGFKATLQLTEVTENFLDLVPDFKAYYNYWNAKEGSANAVSEYVSIMTSTNGGYQSVKNIYKNAKNSATTSLLNIDEKIDVLLKRAYLLARLYARANAMNNGTPVYAVGYFNNSEEKYEKKKKTTNKFYRSVKLQPEKEAEEAGIDSETLKMLENFIKINKTYVFPVLANIKQFDEDKDEMTNKDLLSVEFKELFIGKDNNIPEGFSLSENNDSSTNVISRGLDSFKKSTWKDLKNLPTGDKETLKGYGFMKFETALAAVVANLENLKKLLDNKNVKDNMFKENGFYTKENIYIDSGFKKSVKTYIGELKDLKEKLKPDDSKNKLKKIFNEYLKEALWYKNAKQKLDAQEKLKSSYPTLTSLIQLETSPYNFLLKMENSKEACKDEVHKLLDEKGTSNGAASVENFSINTDYDDETIENVNIDNLIKWNNNVKQLEVFYNSVEESIKNVDSTYSDLDFVDSLNKAYKTYSVKLASSVLGIANDHTYRIKLKSKKLKKVKILNNIVAEVTDPFKDDFENNEKMSMSSTDSYLYSEQVAKINGAEPEVEGSSGSSSGSANEISETYSFKVVEYKDETILPITDLIELICKSCDTYVSALKELFESEKQTVGDTGIDETLKEINYKGAMDVVVKGIKDKLKSLIKKGISTVKGTEDAHGTNDAQETYGFVTELETKIKECLEDLSKWYKIAAEIFLKENIENNFNELFMYENDVLSDVSKTAKKLSENVNMTDFDKNLNKDLNEGEDVVYCYKYAGDYPIKAYFPDKILKSLNDDDSHGEIYKAYKNKAQAANCVEKITKSSTSLNNFGKLSD